MGACIRGCNAGEYRVLSSIMKAEDRDFWKLSDKKYCKGNGTMFQNFSSEACGKKLESLRFSRPSSEGGSYPDLESLEVPSPINLAFQKCEDLKNNPSLHREVISPRVSVANFGCLYNITLRLEIENIC